MLVLVSLSLARESSGLGASILTDPRDAHSLEIPPNRSIFPRWDDGVKEDAEDTESDTETTPTRASTLGVREHDGGIVTGAGANNLG